mgnify:FL=1
MEIISNLLSREKQNEIESEFLRGDFPWYYNSVATYDQFNDHRTLNTPFFGHMFYINNEIVSKHYYPKLVLPIIEALERYKGKRFQNRTWRIKANLYMKDGSYPEDFHHPGHIDNGDENFRGETFLYFVNDADGDTYMFNEHYDYVHKRYGPEDWNGNFTNQLRIPAEKGKAVLFPLTQCHTSSVPRSGGPRITLNFVFGEYF